MVILAITLMITLFILLIIFLGYCQYIKNRSKKFILYAVKGYNEYKIYKKIGNGTAYLLGSVTKEESIDKFVNNYLTYGEPTAFEITSIDTKKYIKSK